MWPVARISFIAFHSARCFSTLDLETIELPAFSDLGAIHSQEFETDIMKARPPSKEKCIERHSRIYSDETQTNRLRYSEESAKYKLELKL